MIIGNQEWCAFPELGIPAIKARVDSGARTSSLHAFNITHFNREGQDWVAFDVHPRQRNRTTNIHCERPIVDQRRVKSSSGDSERRYVIIAPMQLGGEVWEIELTLTNRDSMGFRMLLGREAMSGRVLIDPGASCALGNISKLELKELYQPN